MARVDRTPNAASVPRSYSVGNVAGTGHRWFYRTLVRRRLRGREWVLEMRWRRV